MPRPGRRALVGSTAGGIREEGEYSESVRPIAALGVGKGEGVSLSVVWLPASGDGQLPPRTARLVIYDLGGKPLAEKEVQLAPFTGAAVQVTSASRVRRRSVFGYVFIDPPFDDIFAGLEIYDLSSGQTKLAIPVGNG
jgi:hypothetical protein